MHREPDLRVDADRRVLFATMIAVVALGSACGRVGFDLETEADASLGACPDGCTQESTFCLCPEELPYSLAEESCAAAGLALAKPRDRVENDQMASVIREAVLTHAWIGASDRDREGEWRWLDGTRFWTGGVDGSPLDDAWVYWGPGQPNNLGDGENCAELRGTGRWNDTACSDLRAYICQ